MRTPIFSELITHYLTQYLSVQRNLSSNTIRSYRDTFKLLLSFCRDEKGIRIVKLTIAQLDKQCIEDFLLWLRDIHGVSESTYNQRLCAIRAFFAYVMIEEPSYMEHCKKILDIPSLKTPDREPQYMSADALKRVLSAPDTSTKRGRRHLTILTVLYDTAARVSELTNILIRDVRLDFPASITLHGKGGKIRTVPIMKETVALLKEYFSENHKKLYTLSTWLNSKSILVSRPNTKTVTVIFCFTLSTSDATPLKPANGPSMTCTSWPTSYSTSSAATAPSSTCFIRRCASASDTAIGLFFAPKNITTWGICLTNVNVSLFITI